jgi:hypothetical protein
VRARPWLLAACSLAASACEFDPAGLGGGGGAPDADPFAPDADPLAPDAGPVVPDASTAPPPDAGPCTTWSAVNVGDPCAATLPTPGSLTLASGEYTLDTETGQVTGPGGTQAPPGGAFPQADGPEALLVSLEALDLPASATLVVTGPRPLILVVHGDVTIAGTLDAAARSDTAIVGDNSRPGPGGNSSACGDGTGVAGGSSTNLLGSGGGGGGGGAYGGTGGNGGNGSGNDNGNGGRDGNTGGTGAITPLRGGCAGGPGGDDGVVGIDNGGDAGHGGGAVEITALGSITVTGRVLAGGSGGVRGDANTTGGGGGGGSGGALLLDGDQVTVQASAEMCANGGGGGEGGGGISLDIPADGENATCDENLRAQGGGNNSDGGDGGDGGAQSATSGTNANNGSNDGGGGGGGGGVGRIRIRGRTGRTIDGASTVSPTATM